jgi:sugar (pentulose or hexulose) kinase
MMASGWTIVLDVGKSLSKATLWDEGGVCVAQRMRPNGRAGVAAQGFTLDVRGIERWLEGILAEFATLGPVAAIVPVAHGAAAALIRNDRLQCDPLDYEWSGVAQERPTYDRQRDPFSVTGSPALPAGLNLGLQLHWLDAPRTSGHRDSQILPWAQYWAWLLSGVAASEVTSLGCHTDLWRPYQRRPSELAVRRGWAERFAPLRPAGTVLGRLTPTWVKRTGLSERVEIYCGLHDSNAALLAARAHPSLEGHDATVLSTGTWFVAMRSPLSVDATTPTYLPENRDCLVNVDVTGAPVPSSRFMGGRELEVLIGGRAELVDTPGMTDAWRDTAIRAIESGEMILPSWAPGVGPFPHAKCGRVGAQSMQNEALAYLYAALVADVSLDLIGSRDKLIVDGRFSRSPLFLEALARLRPDTQVLVSQDEHGVARGARRLISGSDTGPVVLAPVAPLRIDMADYRARWREAAERR